MSPPILPRHTLPTSRVRARDDDPGWPEGIYAFNRQNPAVPGRRSQAGEPMTIVEAGCWQAARVAPGGAWSFGGCTVAPGFDFADFEMPNAEDLLRHHPQHEAIVRELTRR
ncbi:MAG TPA: cupin domain-containing protein [Thermoanaerobaculia bacterium]|nr:cupin domain-containing protein [Thermoanaerobaculia bacterium]